MKRRLLSIFLVLMMLFSMMPFGLIEVAAAENLGTVKVRVADEVQRLSGEKDGLMPNYREPFGEILPYTEVIITEGMTMRQALEKALSTEGIAVDGQSDYVTGIGPVTSEDGKRTVNDLSEFDGGKDSGWMFLLNDWSINAGANDFPVTDGDVIDLLYTCNRGADIGAPYDGEDNDTLLKSLSVSKGTLSPAFASETRSYTLTLEEEQEVVVTPTAANKLNRVTIESEGKSYRRTDAIPLKADQEILITCGDSSYFITVAIEDPTQPSLPKENGIYTISSVEEFNAFRSDTAKGITYAGETVVLIEDLDLEGEKLQKVPTNQLNDTAFKGVFDGQGYTIKNFTETPWDITVFPIFYSEPYVVLKNLNVEVDLNLTMEDIRLSGQLGEYTSGSYGVLSTTSIGNIENVSVKGNITFNSNDIHEIMSGNNRVVNICGFVDSFSGTAKNLHSGIHFKQTGDKDYYINGGTTRLVFSGFHNGSSTGRNNLDKSYFNGTYDVYPRITDPDNISSYHEIQPIETRQASSNTYKVFYDKDRLPNVYKRLTTNDNVIPLSTEEMKKQETFEEYGWDFNSIWAIDPEGVINDGYPYLDVKKNVVTFDVQPVVEDKVYDGDLNAKVTDIKVLSPDEESQALMDKYNLKLDYEVQRAVFKDFHGEGPIDIVFKKLLPSYDANDEVQFRIDKVLTATAALTENGNPPRKKEELLKDAQKIHDILMKEVYQDGVITRGFSAQWNIMTLARGGYPVREGFYDEWFNKLAEDLRGMKDGTYKDSNGVPRDLSYVAVTDYQTIVLAVTAIGYDPRNVGGIDCLAPTLDEETVYNSDKYMARSYAQIALDSYNYEPDAPIRESLSGDVFENDYSDTIMTTPEQFNSAVDMMAMGMQAGAAKYALVKDTKPGEPGHSYKSYVEERLTNLGLSQNSSGGWAGTGMLIVNQCSTAQALLAAAMHEVNIFEDPRFVKNGNTIIDALTYGIDFENEKTINGIFQGGMAYYQVSQGIIEAMRMLNGENHFYDMTDVQNSVVDVRRAIEALPEEVTAEHKAAVQKAADLYNKLSQNKKATMREEHIEKLIAVQKLIEDLQKDEAAAQAVEDKIAAIGEVTFKSKQAIHEAREAYDNLSEAQKDLVSNYNTLTDAEAAYKALEEGEDKTDEEAAKAVDEFIGQINVPVSLEDAEAIANARAAYENLSQEQKDLVTKLDKLESAEKALANLQAAKAVEERIDAIGEVTLESKEAIEEARAAYEKLSEVQKELVPNHGTLIEAEEAYKALVSDKSDEERAKEVDDLIDLIGDPVTLEDAEKIQRARAAYAYLTEEQQKLVTKLEELEAAERSLKELEEEKDQDAADQVIKAIDELPADITLKDKEQVAKVRQAYNALSQEQKELVSNEEKLMAAENTIKELEQEAEKVVEQIDALPKDITLKDKEQVEKVRKAYDALSKEQRALVSNEGKLKEAEGKIKQLEEDKVAADKVTDLIHALPDKITLADKEKVEEALAAYNELTEEQKALVDNVNKFIEAKEEITRLEKEEPGTDPGEEPKDPKDSGEDPKEPGKDPGKDPDKGPGKEPKDPGKDPSKGPGKDSGKNPGKGSKNTKTGDTFSPIHWISILGLSAVGVFVIRRKKKKTA